jgi:hypothetical protein
VKIHIDKEDILQKQLIKYKFLYQAVRKQNDSLEETNDRLRKENKYLNCRIKNLMSL